MKLPLMGSIANPAKRVRPKGVKSKVEITWAVPSAFFAVRENSTKSWLWDMATSKVPSPVIAKATGRPAPGCPLEAVVPVLV